VSKNYDNRSAKHIEISDQALQLLSQLKKDVDNSSFCGWIRVHIHLPAPAVRLPETESSFITVKFEDIEKKKIEEFSCHQLILNLDAENLHKFLYSESLKLTVTNLTRPFVKKSFPL